MQDYVDIEQINNLVVATIRKAQLTHLEMQELTVTLEEKMRFDNAFNFIFDFTSVDFISSSCIGSLVTLLQEIEPMKGRVLLAGCHDEVALLFKVTRLDSIFAMFDDVEEAREELAA